MHSSVELKQFVSQIASLPSPVEKLPPILVKRVMQAYILQQQAVYFMADQHGRIIQLGSNIALLCGFSRQELLGMRLDEFLDLKKPKPGQYHSLIQEQSATLFQPNGNYNEMLVKSRQLLDSGQPGSVEGLLCSVDRYQLSSLPASQKTPLLSLSVSAGVLSCNAAGGVLLDALECRLGETLSELMQDRVLDAWCASHPISVAEYVFFPLKKEGIILLSSLPRHITREHSWCDALHLQASKQHAC